MSCSAEFKTVDLVLGLKAETSGVDAFALSLIKAERQIRKLFTYLVFQSPAFLTTADILCLIKTLAADRYVYFNGVVTGFDALSPTPVKELIGPEYGRLWARFCEFARFRNKIFHGQLTGEDLTTVELRTNVDDIKLWCRLLAKRATCELGYDGFARDSFRKSPMPDLANRLQVKIESVEQYAAFIAAHMHMRKSTSSRARADVRK